MGDGGARARSTLRLLLATDNHLGYAEKDPVRGEDSFRAFQEILQLARDDRVDLLLLAGDLFHENKPSRKTMYQTMSLLRAFCMGDGAVQFQIVSDQSLNFPNFGSVNYEDPNYNIELPVFSIHGNHDDPSREAGQQSLAALDLLSAANLVNYFGKCDKVDAIELFPILTVKGDTKVAIYGLGSMRDERLHRMFAQQKVVFRRPAENPESWFSIFVVHQNRDNKGRGAKNCLPESFIPDFIDFVVWGHEHECLVEVQESLKGDFFITQPGSSVATSLIEGEAKTKKVAVLEIHEQSFRLSSRVLKSVRPFMMSEISLAEIEDLDPNDPDVTDRIREVLEQRVLELLAKAEEEHPNRPPELKEVLVRVRVEHTGFPVLVNQRFGSRFVGKVANPNEILLFFRRKKEKTTMGTVDGKPVLATNRVGGSLLDPIRPSRLDTVTIEELLNTQLHKPDNSLVFLPEQSLALALEDYIVKNIPSAIEDFVDGVLEETQRELEKQRTTKSKEEIMEAVEKKKDKMNAAHLVDREESKQPDIAGPSQRSQTQTQPTQGRRRSDSLDDDGDLGVDVSPPKKARGKGSTAATGRFGTPRGKAAAASKPNASKPKTTSRDFDEEEEDDDDYDQRRPVARSKKPAATTPPTRKVSARAASARGRARQRELFSDEDNGDDNDGDEDFEIGDEHEDESEQVADVVTARRGKAPAKKVPAKSMPKKPAGLKRLRKAASDESDAGLDEFEHRQRPTTSSRSRATAAASASDEIDLCSSGSESSKAPPKKSVKTTRVKPTPQPKITALFQKQQEKAKARHDDDDIESDPEFSQLTGTTTTTVNSRPRAVDATNEETASELPSSQSQFLSQFQSQVSTAAKKRKLPLSMLAASQSAPAVKQTKGDDGGTSTLRKGYGRARR